MKIVGMGSHIVECLRVARMIDRHGEQFVNRIYTPREIRYCHSRKQATQHFAARWAAKEAVLQALGLRFRPGMSWSDLEIRGKGRGQYTAAFRGSLRDQVEQLDARQIFVTMAHCRSHATAYALILGEEA